MKRTIQTHYAEETLLTRSAEVATVGAYAIWNYGFLPSTTSS